MKDNTFKKLKWFLANGLFAASLYFGYVQGIEGFENIALFMAWFAIVLAPFSLAEPVLEKLLELGGPAMSDLTEGIFDLSVVATFVFFGAWVTAAFYLVHTIIIQVARIKMREMVWDKLKEENPEYNYDK